MVYRVNALVFHVIFCILAFLTSSAVASDQMELRKSIQTMRSFCFETTKIYSNAFYDISQKTNVSNQEMITATAKVLEQIKNRKLNLKVTGCKEKQLCKQVQKYVELSTRCTQEGMDYLQLMLSGLESGKESDLKKLFNNKRKKLVYLQSTHGLDYKNRVKNVPLDIDARNFSFFMYSLYGELIKVVDAYQNGGSQDSEHLKAALLKVQKRAIDSTYSLSGLVITQSGLNVDNSKVDELNNKIEKVRLQFKTFSDEFIRLVVESASSLNTEKAASTLLENIELIVIDEELYRHHLRSFRDTAKQVVLWMKTEIDKEKSELLLETKG